MRARSLLLTCVMLVACGAAATSTSTGVTIQPLAPAPMASAAPKPAAATGQAGMVRIDKTMTFADSEWVIIEVRDAGKALPANDGRVVDAIIRSEGRFILVHYRLKNLGNKVAMVMVRPSIVDSRGRKFLPIDTEAGYLPPHTKPLGPEELQPSVPNDYWTAIEVPGDATDLAIEVHGFTLIGPTQDVSLGL